MQKNLACIKKPAVLPCLSCVCFCFVNIATCVLSLVVSLMCPDYLQLFSVCLIIIFDSLNPLCLVLCEVILRVYPSVIAEPLFCVLIFEVFLFIISSHVSGLSACLSLVNFILHPSSTCHT